MVWQMQNIPILFVWLLTLMKTKLNKQIPMEILFCISSFLLTHHWICKSLIEQKITVCWSFDKNNGSEICQ